MHTAESILIYLTLDCLKKGPQSIGPPGGRHGQAEFSEGAA